MSEIGPSLKEEIEKLIEERVPKENTAVLQRIEALALEISRQNQELRHQRELMQQGFDVTNKRIEELQHRSDKRFEEVLHYSDKHSEDMNNYFNTLQWMIGIGFTAITILMVFFRFYAASSG